MKNIVLKDIRIKEVVIQPESETPMAITYELLDDNDQVLTVKNTTVKREEFTTKGQKAITDFAADLLTKVKEAEQFQWYNYTTCLSKTHNRSLTEQ